MTAAVLTTPRTDTGRGSTARRAVSLVLALEDKRRGLRLTEVEEIIGVSRRNAYRWIERMVETGRYEWKKQFLRRTREGECW